MPDWISHLLFGLIICHLLSIQKKSLVLLGALLPDLIGKLKMLNYLFPGSPEWIIPISNFWHTPLPSFISVLLIALFFSYPYLNSVFLIWLGDVSHFLSDETTKSFLFNGYFPLIWADQYYFAIIFFAITYTLLRIFDLRIIRDEHQLTTN